jgi:hypothetical protein
MKPFDFASGLTVNDRLRVENADGIEFLVSDAVNRRPDAERLASALPDAVHTATSLLADFLKTQGPFSLETVEVHAERTPSRGDFMLSLSDTSESACGSTYFDVFFHFTDQQKESPPIFHPIGFAVSFG